MIKERISTTSWSTDKLSQLCNPSNHKIKFAGFQYRWYHKLDGKWELHSIKHFDNFNKPFSWMQFNLGTWTKELRARGVKEAARMRAVERKIRKISEEHDYDTFNKVIEISKLDSELTAKDISLILGVSVQMTRKYIKLNK